MERLLDLRVILFPVILQFLLARVPYYLHLFHFLFLPLRCLSRHLLFLLLLAYVPPLLDPTLLVLRIFPCLVLLPLDSYPLDTLFLLWLSVLLLLILERVLSLHALCALPMFLLLPLLHLLCLVPFLPSLPLPPLLVLCPLMPIALLFLLFPLF